MIIFFAHSNNKCLCRPHNRINDESKIDESIRRNTHVKERRKQKRTSQKKCAPLLLFSDRFSFVSCVRRRSHREKIVVMLCRIRCLHLEGNIYRGWCVRDKEKWKCAAKCLISVFCFLSCLSALLRTGERPDMMKIFSALTRNFFFKYFFTMVIFSTKFSSFD